MQLSRSSGFQAIGSIVGSMACVAFSLELRPLQWFLRLKVELNLELQFPLPAILACLSPWLYRGAMIFCSLFRFLQILNNNLTHLAISYYGELIRLFA